MSRVASSQRNTIDGPSGSSRQAKHSNRIAGGAQASDLKPWQQEQPSAEELTLYTTLSAYADALDALPLDLTRSFSDLRELDAVLGPHLTSLTNRLSQLTAVIEDESFTQGERLLALKDVAEEARAYKMGGEDKIRVALNTAETIISHTTYIDTLLANLTSVPSLAKILSPPIPSHLAGHLSDGTALAPGSGPGGNNPAIADSYAESPSPVKRKKPGQGVGQSSSSASAAAAIAEEKGGKASASSQAAANAAKKRKPTAQTATSSAKARAAAAHDDGDSAARRPAVKRARANGNASGAGPAGNGEDDGRDRDTGVHTSSSRSRAGRNRNANVREGDDDDDGDGDDDVSDAGFTAPRSARVARAPRAVDDATSNAPALGDDADERRYCFCNNVSYGDMIGCDGDDCEREWFHLGCVGLLKPPQGTWYCDDCAQKRASRNKKPKSKLAKTSGAHGGGVVETKARSASTKR